MAQATQVLQGYRLLRVKLEDLWEWGGAALSRSRGDLHRMATSAAFTCIFSEEVRYDSQRQMHAVAPATLCARALC